MENLLEYIDIILPAAFILFWGVLYALDRIEKAKLRRQFTKSDFRDREYERPKKPWGIYILISVFVLLFLYILLSRYVERTNTIYEQAYEDGFQAGVEAVLQTPEAYF